MCHSSLSQTGRTNILSGKSSNLVTYRREFITLSLWMQGFFGQLALGSSPPLQLHHETEQLSQTLSHLHCCSNLVLDLNCNRWPFISNDTNYKEEGIKKNSYMILNKVPLMMSHKYNN